MARLASGEGARREGAQASGLTSEAHAQVPQTRGAFLPSLPNTVRSLGAPRSLVQETQGCSAPSLPRSCRWGEGAHIGA